MATNPNEDSQFKGKSRKALGSKIENKLDIKM